MVTQDRPSLSAVLDRPPDLIPRTGARPAAGSEAVRDPRPTDSGASRRRRGGLYLLLAVVAVLNVVGLVMVLSASSVQSLRQFATPWHYFERQVLWLVIAVVAFAVAYRVDYRRWRQLSRPVMIATLLLLVAVLVPGIGIRSAGASRWIGTSSWQIQPSEFAKLALILFAADVADRRADRGDWRYRMMPIICVLAVLAVLVMRQPDMGTTIVLACIALAVLFAAGSPLKPLGGFLLAGGVGSLIMAVAAPYRWRRMTSFLHPFDDASNTGYQSAQALVTMGSGGLFGTGIGRSVASWGYLPNQQTDFIFAVIAEETGLFGSLIVSGLFVVLAVTGARIACRAPDRFGGLFAAGITAWLVGQAVINIGAVVGLLPVTGVPLPFVSFGGSSLVFAMFGVGILANVAKQS